MTSILMLWGQRQCEGEIFFWVLLKWVVGLLRIWGDGFYL